jgi:hypothetical protein
MSTIIAINDSTSEIFIEDLGIEIPALGQRDLTEVFSKQIISESKNLVTFVSNGNIIINNGSINLSISNGLKHINIQTEYEDSFDEIFGGGNGLPPDPYPGQPYYTNGIPYYWDSIREKWLSCWIILNLSKDGSSDGSYLRLDNVSSSDAGWYLHRPATITGIYCRSVSGYAYKYFEIRDGSQSDLMLYSFSYNNSQQYINSDVNTDLNQGSILKVYVGPAGIATQNCVCQIEIAWRYSV